MDYSSWSIKPKHIEGHLAILFERFLLGTLAVGASRMGTGFIEALNISNSAMAQAYLERMRKIGFEPQFKDSASEVEEAIVELGCDPWNRNLGAYYFGTRSEKEETLSEIKALPEYIQSKESKLAAEATPLIKRRFVEIDSIYRHLRNALAHGCFRLLEREKAPDIFFYDIDRNGSVSCCAVLPFDVLEALHRLNCDIAEKRL